MTPSAHVPIPELSLDDLLDREWLAVNHLGGYASSTVCSLNTRKYHGLLVSAENPPVGRQVVLARVEEFVQSQNSIEALAANDYPGIIHPQGYKLLAAFSPDPYPRWAYRAPHFTLEKSLRLLPGTNAVLLSYTLLTADHEVELEVRPLVAMRPMHWLIYQHSRVFSSKTISPFSFSCKVGAEGPEAYFAHNGQTHGLAHWYLNQLYRREEQRGYAHLEDLWSPCVVKWKLTPGQTAMILCSTQPMSLDEGISAAHSTPEFLPSITPSNQHPTDLLALAAAKFVADIPADKTADQPASFRIISDFPWSAPSIRSALIGFTGGLLTTGLISQAQQFLQYCHQLSQSTGLIPSDTMEDATAPATRGCDTTLYFIHAVHDFLKYTGNKNQSHWAHICLNLLHAIGLPALGASGLSASQPAVPWIVIDSGGLLCTRQPNQPNTWMDAKVNDWVVTPRAGRPVGLNALWYSALKIVQHHMSQLGQPDQAAQLGAMADKVKTSFANVFWNEVTGCCFDCVDDSGPDESLRPDQLYAAALPFPVLDDAKARRVVRVVKEQLLTPYGLRTLAPSHSAYVGRYAGAELSRDASIYNGCVHPFLLQLLIRAHLRLTGRAQDALDEAKLWLQPLVDFAASRGLGMLPELFDGDAPHRPGGAVGSFRSVAGILQAFREDLSPKT